MVGALIDSHIPGGGLERCVQPGRDQTRGTGQVLDDSDVEDVWKSPLGT